MLARMPGGNAGELPVCQCHNGMEGSSSPYQETEEDKEWDFICEEIEKNGIPEAVAKFISQDSKFRLSMIVQVRFFELKNSSTIFNRIP